MNSEVIDRIINTGKFGMSARRLVTEESSISGEKRKLILDKKRMRGGGREEIEKKKGEWEFGIDRIGG